MNVRKSDIYGIVGSALFCGVVVLLLVLIAMPGQPVPEDEGIVVSFGTSFEGGGQQVAEALPAPQPQPEAPQPAAPQPEPQPAEEMLTQESPSVAMQEQQEQEEEAARLAEEQRRREEEEARLAEERRIAEQKRQQEAIERAQATVGSVFGQTVTPEGSGTGEGDARQGNPVGQGSSEGHSWSLDGRALVGKLIDPLYEVNVEGRVTVSIRVDESGNVVGVSIGRPTDISDAAIQQAALDAARKAKFSVGDNVAVGTITYHFKLK